MRWKDINYAQLDSVELSAISSAVAVKAVIDSTSRSDAIISTHFEVPIPESCQER